MNATQLNLFTLPSERKAKSRAKPSKAKPGILPGQFTTVLAYLDSIPAINKGGCGISALAIYRWCKANGVPVSDRPFVILCRSKEGAERNDTALNRGDLDAITIPHVVIEVNGTLWDSTGSESQSQGLFQEIPYRTPYHLSEHELLETLNEQYDRWNETFRRKSSIPKIERRLQVDLSDVVR